MGSPRHLLVLGLFGTRVAYGGALVCAPRAAAGPWLGRAAGEDATQVGLRGMGVREMALGALGIAAAVTGGPVRPVLVATLLGDAADLSSTVRARRSLPEGALTKTAVVAGAGILLSAALAAGGRRP